MKKMNNDFVDQHWYYKRLKSGRPMNESEEHFFCKNVGQLFLFHRHNCRYIGTEIDGCFHMDSHISGHSPKGKTNPNKSIIDVLGMTRKYDVYGVEAKATLADFRNGFCAPAPYTYIICPEGVIPPDEVPKGIGLVYVDIPNFHIVGYDDVRGLGIVKQARLRWDKRWYNQETGQFDDDEYNDWIDKCYGSICFRNTIKNVFNKVNIPIYRRDVLDDDVDDNDGDSDEENLFD